MVPRNGQSGVILLISFSILILMIGFIFFLPVNKDKSSLQSDYVGQEKLQKVIPKNTSISPSVVSDKNSIKIPIKKTPSTNNSGIFACSPDGECRIYSLEVSRENCTKTFAERNCLGQCKDTSIQCKL